MLSITINLRIIAKIFSAFLFIIVFSSWGKLANQYSLRTKAGVAAFIPKVTKHQIQLNGHALNYHAETGYLTVKNNEQKPVAHIYYTAYNAVNKKKGKARPVTFIFNGGPGSSSIWLHMGAFGPVKADTSLTGEKQYADNPATWLDFTDLIFIDPVSTGYSQPADGVDARRFYGYKEDIGVIGKFIKSYIDTHQRQLSPKFLAGESYGGLRAVGLASYLQDSLSTEVAGVTLISPALNYQLITFKHGNETPYPHFLPSYAITAQHHNKMNKKLQQLTQQQLVAKVEHFAYSTYAYFLNQGDAAPYQLQQRVIDSLSYYTGLSKTYLQQVKGRVSNREFSKNLLPHDEIATGIFDSRYTGAVSNGDPSVNIAKKMLGNAFGSYVVDELNYVNKLPYQATTVMRGWKFGPEAVNGYINASATLAAVMAKNPNLKVNIVGGYYDVVTPVSSIQYVINHLELSSQLKKNITVNYYPTGHMPYLTAGVGDALRAEGIKFYTIALKQASI